MSKDMVIFDAPELQHIDPSRAKQIKAVFEPMATMLEKFEVLYAEISNEAEREITKELISKARRLRLDIGKVRIETERARKTQKEEYLRGGKAIDGVSNILKWAVTEKENKLREIENYFEIQERARLDALQKERAEKLSHYVEDAHDRKLADMEEDVWNAYYATKKKEYEDRILAEQEAEEARKKKEEEEAKERERIKAENERLKKEAQYAIEKAKRDAAERAKRDLAEKAKRERAERAKKAKEEKEKREREEKEAKVQAEHEAKLEAERTEKEKIRQEEAAKRKKLEDELKAKEEKERREREEKEAKVQAELAKDDGAKIVDLINDLENLKSKYVFKSANNIKMYADIGILIESAIDHIKRT